uniref:uncharacterized protein KIAA1841-like n=1 Tax=Styela clava TaxID=7725 RepID=UPI00193A3801|nr:uncharacterized protein KIAA1841-like [Styela clava]
MSPKKINEQEKYPEMLDTLLKNFVAMTINDNLSSSTPSTPPINWQALSDSLPDTSPEMCKRRFVELRNLHLVEREQGEYVSNKDPDGLYDYVQMLFKKDEKERKRINKAKKRAEQKKQKQEYDDPINTDCDTRSTTPSTYPPYSNSNYTSKMQGGPSMVIHVCDEAKNLRQDFTCPRDLLIQEMRYFAEYLSVDSQRLEEVDISVHCDIHIFDWLMRYVKRNSGLVDAADKPKLEPSNVVSILISSDFLKMDSLVEECIGYCHDNLSQIVSTPCNMNCVNEKLTERIASRFSHVELEEVKDRKDKFKSKLFCRKIEELFSPSVSSDSPGSASTLFRCNFCRRVITLEQKDAIPCTNTRMCINSRGMLSYEHEPDTSWDVSNYVLNLHEELKKWGLVYWRLWGVVNHLTCSRCEQTFQLCDFGQCHYHAERPQFRQLLDMQVSDHAVGLYPCCNQRILRFDPTGVIKGCRLRDHVVTPTNKKEDKLLEELQNYKNLIKVTDQLIPVSSDLNIFSAEESICGVDEPTSTPAEIMSPPPLLPPQPKLSPVTIKVQRTVSPSDMYYTGLADNSEEDTGEEETTPKHHYKPTPTPSHMSSISSQNSSTDIKQINQNQLSVAITPSGAVSRISNQSVKKGKTKSAQHTDDTAYGKFPSKQKWENARSIRWNQDVQREEDMKRIVEMTSQLSKKRVDKGDKAKTKDSREYPGGMFSKLEVNFYSNLRSNSITGMGSGRQPGGSSNRDNRIRGRQGQLAIKNISMKYVTRPRLESKSFI